VRGLFSLADLHAEAEAVSKDSAATCLIPPAFRETGLCSLKKNHTSASKTDWHSSRISSKQNTLQNPECVAECSGQRSNCCFQVVLSFKQHY